MSTAREHQRQRIAADPAGAIDYFLYQRGDVRGSLIGTGFANCQPGRRQPGDRCIGASSARNIVGGGKEGGGIIRCLPLNCERSCFAVHPVGLKLNVGVGDGCIERHGDIIKAQANDLIIAIKD